MKQFWIFCVSFAVVLCFVLSPATAYATGIANPGAEMGEESPENPPQENPHPGMFDTTASLGKAFIDGLWGLFGIYVPGFSFTFGQMWLGVLLCSLSILVIKILFGIGGSGGDSPRTGSTNNPKISKERRNDEF